MYKNVIVIVINYIAILQIFKSYKIHIFPALPTAGMGKHPPTVLIRPSLSQLLAIPKISLVS